ncbi:Prophage CP4-57 regulatory protein (AlpA) [Tepidimonas alkaliphilus]|uniref:Prophage CP4-57 regulatory protein (AlpA) n=1 Tax=Tepidimonas alkaliphilus TaxID=2588942 RepID=A0A554W4I7_9BURK|nr:AlpA family phage regulatory protein [Tepidimonas alkaliphilus]TSE18490.1 Prophage CP4-57 regulatory protein (AlpA) [Tepidimonas alkaliphilus]
MNVRRHGGEPRFEACAAAQVHPVAHAAAPCSGERLLSVRDVLALVRLSRSTWYELVRTGQAPRPLRVGARAVRWRASDLQAWLDRLPR